MFALGSVSGCGRQSGSPEAGEGRSGTADEVVIYSSIDEPDLTPLLERFEKDIKPQLELKSLTYGKGTALGDKGFVLNDVVAVVPGSATGGFGSGVFGMGGRISRVRDLGAVRRGTAGEEIRHA